MRDLTSSDCASYILLLLILPSADFPAAHMLTYFDWVRDWFVPFGSLKSISSCQSSLGWITGGRLFWRLNTHHCPQTAKEGALLIGLGLFIPFPLNNSNKTLLIGSDLFFKTCFGSVALPCGLVPFFSFEEGNSVFSCCEIQVTWSTRTHPNMCVAAQASFQLWLQWSV